ncbi:hypothetical protein GCM10017083_05790 [Thalassobaculum fulvum]|uniref:DUF218 domain-containing protein n=1 Tax=Thalassobaculum fulvum TaxID=1633335 RepID=A0A918XPF5_9PROT|nr:YdcF family protein [Thalassobaculum fulvum]GHD41400.1 hypothetical protein GCM10017083_05790 [Thalassobaculum fulvum]
MARRRYRFRREPRRPRSGIRLAVLVVVLSLAVAWSVGLVRYANRIPMHSTPPTTQADAIVVLTGGSKRMEAGVELLTAGTAPVLFVSGVDHRVDPARVRDLVPGVGASLDQATIDCCIVLGYGASDTLGNARETALWARATGRKSLVLVTSNYHMPRAWIEFEHALPEIALVPFPVVPADVRVNAWWRWPGTFGLIAGEWTKYVFARVRIALAELVASPRIGDARTE